jgi:hypothetical protein
MTAFLHHTITVEHLLLFAVGWFSVDIIRKVRKNRRNKK